VAEAYIVRSIRGARGDRSHEVSNRVRLVTIRAKHPIVGSREGDARGQRQCTRHGYEWVVPPVQDVANRLAREEARVCRPRTWDGVGQ